VSRGRIARAATCRFESRRTNDNVIARKQHAERCKSGDQIASIVC